MFGDPAPLVSGLTETAPDGDSPILRLAALLSRRPGGASQDIGEAMGMLQTAYGKESNADVRARLAAALGLLGGCGPADDTADTARDRPIGL